MSAAQQGGGDSYPPPTDLPDYPPPTTVDVPPVPDDAVVPSVPVANQPVVLDFADSQLDPHSASGAIAPPPGEAPDASLLGGHDASDPSADAGKIGWLSLKRFQKYFDVETKDVLWRMGNACLGPIKGNFYENVKENADLYGPFWVTTTVVFMTAVSSNIVNYWDYYQQSEKDKEWTSDLSKLMEAAIMYYAYVFGVGFALWGFLRCFKSDVHLSHIWCMYGYSLTVFLPVSFVLMMKWTLARRLVIAAVTIYSGLFLLRNLKEAIYSAAPGRATVVLIVMGAIHCVIGVVLALAFH